MSWSSYSDGHERKAELARKMARRSELGETFIRVEAPGGSKKLVNTFWGRSWCLHLETYHDYEGRLPRGRSYLRQGNVYNLNIEPEFITAQVAGAELYDVEIRIAPLEEELWHRFKETCAGQVDSVLDLLAGKVGDGLLKVIANPETGLFPAPKEIRFSCTCPDWANMCKHVAAVLYGVGVKFDVDPQLFFGLRNVNPAELLSAGAKQALNLESTEGAFFEDSELGSIFGIDLA
ncbi:MAG: SWIM zinc finger family protein [Verrucomicrobiota bacterium]